MGGLIKCANPKYQEDVYDAIRSGQDVYDAIRSDDWRKLIGFFESSSTMIRIICDAKPKEPLINILIAYNTSRQVILDTIDVLEPEVLEATNFNGDTALHVAASYGHIGIVRALLDKNIKLINSINLEGEIPLLKAALNGQREMFWELYYRGSKIKARRYDGATALHCAVMANHFELAYEIVEKNPELMVARDQLGLTILHHMVSIPDAFRSGCRLSPLDALLYKCVIITGKRPRPDPDEGDEEDPYLSGYDQVGHQRSGIGQFKLLELHDEADQPNGFIKFFKPYERWIQRQIFHVMRIMKDN